MWRTLKSVANCSSRAPQAEACATSEIISFLPGAECQTAQSQPVEEDIGQRGTGHESSDPGIFLARAECGKQKKEYKWN
jgi:hypothetical protein